MKPPRAQWTPVELKILDRLKTPLDVQGFLNEVGYSPDKFARSPRRVMKDRKANCYDGALFAAAALRRQGYPPLLLDLRAVRDDDHVLALFARRQCWGSVAKSNFVGLRYREPIHRSLRELAISYFNDYFNTAGEKTLRGYSARAFDLSKHDALDWMTSDDGLDELGERLDRARHVPLLDARQVAGLAPVDARTLEAGLVGSVKDGLFEV